MILTIDELKQLVKTDEPDIKLKMRLDAIEETIRSYTHNNFISRNTLQEASVLSGVLVSERDNFNVGDTIELFGTESSDGLYVVSEKKGYGTYKLDRDTAKDTGTVALVSYPNDVKFGAVKMLQYDIDADEREGIASETISRHSVSYVSQGTGNTSAIGYPLRLTGFLKPYRRMQT